MVAATAASKIGSTLNNFFNNVSIIKLIGCIFLHIFDQNIFLKREVSLMYKLWGSIDFIMMANLVETTRQTSLLKCFSSCKLSATCAKCHFKSLRKFKYNVIYTHLFCIIDFLPCDFTMFIYHTTMLTVEG